MITIENETQLKNALDKLTEQDFISHRQNDYAEIATIITNGLKSEIRLINNMNPDKDEQDDCREEIVNLSPYNLNGYIALFCDVVDAAFETLYHKTVAIYKLMNRLMPFESDDIKVESQ